jgi:hypothetical protein
MATTNTAHELSTAAGCEALYKKVSRNLRRDDFPANAEGWQMWCDHRIRKHTKEAAEANTKLEYWKSVRAGEHLQQAASKLEELNKALAEAKRLQAEVDMLKAQQNQKKA